MARRAMINLELRADFSSAAKELGKAIALSESANDDGYLADLVRAAHGTVEQTFNTEAAALAASGRIKHMYEWGTLGINRGRSNVRPQPMSPRARLWRTQLAGRGLDQTLTYTFMPSVGTTPQPTARDTGMDPETVSLMRPHVFTWKARVMETGEVVTVAPKQSKFLLIPIFKSEHHLFPTYVRKRGYIMTTESIRFSPGQRTMGNFTQFWLGFWEGRGGKRMDSLVGRQLENDFIIRPTATSARPRKRTMPGEFKKLLAIEVKKSRAAARAAARTRATAARSEQ